MAYDRPFRAGERDENSQFEQQTRVRIEVAVDRLVERVPWRWPLRLLGEFQDSRTNGDDGDDFATLSRTAVVNRFDVLQLLLATTVPDVWQTGMDAELHLGRMTLDIGRRDLVGRQFFGNVLFNFDGVHLALSRRNDWRLRLFVVRPVVHTPSTLDPMFADSRGGADDRLFWGVYHELPWPFGLTTQLSYFGFNDKPAKPKQQRHIQTFGLRIVQAPHPGGVDVDLQTTWQVGTISPAGSTRRQRLFAHYQHAELGYSFALPWQPRITGVFDYFSGTDAPGSRAGFNGTFQPLFGPRHFDLVPTGIFASFQRSNLFSPGFRFIVRPMDDLVMQVWGRQWNLASTRDAFVGSGLQDPTGAVSSNLGKTLDVRVQWNVGLTNIWVQGGYVHWFKGGYFTDLRRRGLTTLPDDDTNVWYLQTTLRF